VVIAARLAFPWRRVPFSTQLKPVHSLLESLGW